jgi:hypothetical protein
MLILTLIIFSQAQWDALFDIERALSRNSPSQVSMSAISDYIGFAMLEAAEDTTSAGFS